jgi:hypothetical protein
VNVVIVIGRGVTVFVVFACDGSLIKHESKSKSKLCYDRRFSRSVCLGIKHPSGAYDQIFVTVRLSSDWYLEIQFVPHRKHITSPLTQPNRIMLFRDTVTVYREDDTKHTSTISMQSFS